MLEPLSQRGTSECRACGAADLQSILDLGDQPLANRLLRSPSDPDPAYPLHLKICATCAMGQVGEFVTPQDIFSDYPYLSSMSSYWLNHVTAYGTQMRAELALTDDDLIIEIASNDGALLKGFRNAGNRVLGIEPAANVAAIANADGVRTECAFFGRETAERVLIEHGRPRLIAANNVLAHVPDLDDFVGGLAALCGDETVVTVENPTLSNLLSNVQFDTIYHEHFSYLSAHAISRLAARHGLCLVRVDNLETHGGSNRYWLSKARNGTPDDSVARTIGEELARGLLRPDTWAGFAEATWDLVISLREWLDEMAAAGRTVAGYGAAAKGNTFLNAVGPMARGIKFAVDASPEKQGMYLPGTKVPVHHPDHLRATPVDEVLVLPWNLVDEIAPLVRERASDARIWVAVPKLETIG
jgi:hypothetical protein